MSVMPVNPRRAVIMPIRGRPTLKMTVARRGVIMRVVPGVAAAKAGADASEAFALEASGFADAAFASALAAAQEAANLNLPDIAPGDAGKALIVKVTEDGYELGEAGAVDSVNGQTGIVALDADDIDDTSTTNKFVIAGELASIGSALQPTDIGTTVQAWDAGLDAIAALAVTDSNIIVGNGTTWVAESGATARTSLGLSTSSNPEFATVNIGHGSDTTFSRIAGGRGAIEGKEIYTAGGVTDVAIADGGTGASSAATALTNLGAAPLANPVFTGLVTTAGQIKFPATANPSADVNTLDDYEEGTFTPTFTFGTPGNLVRTYSIQAGDYTKIGNRVVGGLLFQTATFTHSTASGLFIINGLPFVCGTAFVGAGSAIMRGYTRANFHNLQLETASAAASFYVIAGGSAQTPSELAVADFPTGGAVWIYANYQYQA